MAHMDLVKQVYNYFNAKKGQGIELTTEEQTMLLSAENLKDTFVVSALSFDDIKDSMENMTEPLPECVMETIAKKMGEDYCEQLFWEHLPTITNIVLENYRKAQAEKQKNQIKTRWENNFSDINEITDQGKRILKEWLYNQPDQTYTFPEGMEVETTFYGDGYYLAKVKTIEVDGYGDLVLHTNIGITDEQDGDFTYSTITDILAVIMPLQA